MKIIRIPRCALMENTPDDGYDVKVPGEPAIFHIREDRAEILGDAADIAVSEGETVVPRGEYLACVPYSDRDNYIRLDGEIEGERNLEELLENVKKIPLETLMSESDRINIYISNEQTVFFEISKDRFSYYPELLDAHCEGAGIHAKFETTSPSRQKTEWQFTVSGDALCSDPCDPDLKSVTVIASKDGLRRVFSKDGEKRMKTAALKKICEQELRGKDDGKGGM